MTLYVKKRIPVEAQKFDWPEDAPEGRQAYERLYAFAGGLVKQHIPSTAKEYPQYFVFDYLHNTWVEFKRGDWIIKGVRGEFYPVEESVFAETYEEYLEDDDDDDSPLL